MIEAYPLFWPQGYPRNISPSSSRFDTSFASARDETLRQISRIGGTGIVISTNMELRRDGIPYATGKKPKDCGVAVYFSRWKNKVNHPYVFCCDKWDSVADNMQAISKSIEAIRGLERWGVSEMMERAFTGFEALPPPSQQPTTPTIPTKKSIHWYEALGVSEHATAKEIREAFTSLCKQHHPDRGGSAGRFNQVHQAMAVARQLGKVA